MMIAGIFHIPRWAITEGEAERVAAGFAKFARWYDIPEVPERITDHYAFFSALIMVYGSRIATEWNEYHKRPEVMPPQPPRPATATNGATPEGQREPPDPRNWRSVDVDGVGTVDIPPVTGGQTH